MTKEEMVETSTELKKDSGKFLVKTFAWAALLGASLVGVINNYARGSNATMMSGLLDGIVEKEKEE